QESGDDRLLAAAACTHAEHQFAQGHLRASLEELDHGWQIADRLNDPGLTFMATAQGAAANRLLHDYPPARAGCERELATPRRSGVSGGREVLLAYLARARGECGQVAEGRALAAQMPDRPRTFLGGHFLSVALAAWNGERARLEALTIEAAEL